jgi:hypothetical protein
MFPLFKKLQEYYPLDSKQLKYMGVGECGDE